MNGVGNTELSKPMKKLLVISSAPATLVDGKFFLDIKFVEGMRSYDVLWDGPVACLLRQGHDTFAFGQAYTADQLSFSLKLLPEDNLVTADDIAGYDTILCCGDSHEYLHLAQICQETKAKLIFTIENISETRRQITLMDRSRSLPRKLYSLLWILKQERRRKRAFRIADGLQSNGYPSFATYGPLNGNAMMYIDSRVGADLLATKAEMDVRQKRLLDGAPLRLMHSGRLEPIKGSQDLVAVARRLASQDVAFELNIFGSGSLEAEIRSDIKEHKLDDRVKLHGAVDFETELVPFARTHADVYLSCHLQSDPSCTYIESMGCGLPIVGYGNQMWTALCQDSQAGWVTPLGKTDDFADAIMAADADRHQLVTRCTAAHEFAKARSFDNEFRRRIAHLAQA